MPTSYRAFSLRQFAGGLVFSLIGTFYLLSLAASFIAHRSYTIYIIPVLVSPIFLGIGIWIMLKSLRAPFCQSCQTELITKMETYTQESEPKILHLVKCKNKQRNPSSIQFADKKAPSSITVNLTYCPSCVALGSIQIVRKNLEEKQTILNESLKGSIVREVKDKLCL